MNVDRPRRFPGWVRLALIVVAVIALLCVAMLIVGGLGGHGPQRHMGSGSVVKAVR